MEALLFLPHRLLWRSRVQILVENKQGSYLKHLTYVHGGSGLWAENTDACESFGVTSGNFQGASRVSFIEKFHFSP